MIANYLIGSGILYTKQSAEQPKQLPLMENPIKELKTLINEELKDCNGFLWPKVCELQSTEKGKARLEDMIVRMVADEGMSIGSAIAHVEQELSHII